MAVSGDLREKAEGTSEGQRGLKSEEGSNAAASHHWGATERPGLLLKHLLWANSFILLICVFFPPDI